MLAVEIELLTGRYVATAHDDRRSAEWPPHPARFFSALVAALHERSIDERERSALQWLERQPPPSLTFSGASHRDVRDVFVPVNDVTAIGDLEAPLREALEAQAALSANQASAAELKKSAKAVEAARKKLGTALANLGRTDEEPSSSALKAATALLPESRTRQARTFPVVVPDEPRVVLGWSQPPPEDVLSGLQALCARVTRLGHSSSLVWCRALERDVTTPTLVPRDDGEVVLRVVGPGQLERLERLFEHHRGVAGRVLPALPQRYGRPPSTRQATAHSSFASDGWIVFERVGGARLELPRAADLAHVLRAAILEQSGGTPLPPALSGHDAAGAKATSPHLAFVSLPFVGHTHADGSLKAVAVVPPRGLSADERETLFRLVAQWVRQRGTDGVLELAGRDLPTLRVTRALVPTLASTNAATWSRPASIFATATPIVLDRYPGNLRSNQGDTARRALEEAEASISQACLNIGLPAPRMVRVSSTSAVMGAPPARAFQPARRTAGRPPRVHVHAMLEFAEAIQGPVILGASRHLGLGLCLPLE